MTKERKRRENLTGSIRERGNGIWEGRISIDGVRKSLYGKTETEVRRKIRQYRSSIESGWKEPKKIKFADYLYDYIKTFKYGVIKDSSYDRLETVYNCHIKDTIGKKQLGSITTKDIQNLINIRANPPDGCEIKPLAKSGIKRIIDLLNPCLKYAVRKKHIQENPMDDVVIPLNYKKSTVEQFSLNSEELEKLRIACCKKTEQGNYRYRFGLFFMLLVNTGLRPGELLALEWNDIDFENKIISITKTVETNVINRSGSGGKRKDIVTTTKTINGVRFIPINDNIYFYLNEILEENKKYNIITDYVASSSTGTMARLRNLERTFVIVRNNANIQYCNPYTLRHTFGSILIEKGVEISVVSKLMGHSNTTITYNKYIHVLDKQKIKAMKLLDVV